VKILVFGKHGQVGSQLCRLLEEQGKFELIALDIEDLDLTELDAIEDCLKTHCPKWVVNASAYTAVDRAESEPGLAQQLNAHAPETMAKTCQKIGASMIHYSTDYIFDGLACEPYVETDQPDPQSVYGTTKLAGEAGVLSNLPRAIIFRTAWVFSKAGQNFVNTMLRLATENQSIRVVGDQFGCPTLADDLAEVTVNVLNAIAHGGHRHQGGVYHATGQGETSWYGFCQKIMALSGNEHIQVTSISTAEYPTPAPRPAYSVLANNKLRQVYAQQLPHWHDSLERCLKQQ
jgi:dTDP-4-dehydrorhamnose reductase